MTAIVAEKNVEFPTKSLPYRGCVRLLEAFEVIFSLIYYILPCHSLVSGYFLVACASQLHFLGAGKNPSPATRLYQQCIFTFVKSS